MYSHFSRLRVSEKNSNWLNQPEQQNLFLVTGQHGHLNVSLFVWSNYSYVPNTDKPKYDYLQFKSIK